MKTSNYSYGIVTFMLLNFVILLAVDNYAAHFSFNNKSDLTKAIFNNIDSLHLECPNSSQSSNLVQGLNYFFINGFEKSNKKIVLLNKQTNDFVESCLRQYVAAEINFPVKLWRTQIIFPSHYFW
ncbi:MAG: hypothetical protein B7C24_14590 [Bacteroidetes bacterium 4572_77]|nr:MAG: hypothetical protein B7C24_14590 [Bacteroidetes bacterium 4572_77]